MASQHVGESTSAHSPATVSVPAHQPGHRARSGGLGSRCAWAWCSATSAPALCTRLKECLHAAGGEKASVADLFGILSLMFWALIMVVTVKYLTFVMRADHNGEGGIFALLAIVPERFRTQCGPERQGHRHGAPGRDRRLLVVWRWRDHAGDFGARAPSRG